jgi:SAM-dependent methyltransferase
MDFETRISTLEQKVAENEIELFQLRETLHLSGVAVPPPKHLQLRVVGVFGSDFVPGGVRGITILKHHLAKYDNFSRIRRVWDFGCGCGRLSTHFARQHAEITFAGSDIDPEAIQWLNDTRSKNIEYKVNSPWPPCEFEGQFDLIYSVSVFTHLPEDMQLAWLSELARMSAPSGLLMLTTRAKSLLQYLPAENHVELDEKGFYYQDGPTTDGLPDFYRTTYHTDHYIRTVWSKYFEILEIVAGGYDTHMDIVICRRRS